MYIRLTKTKYNKEPYVYLVEAYRDAQGKSQQRTVKKYGLLSEVKKEYGEDAIDKLRQKASVYTKEEIQEFSMRINVKEKALDETSNNLPQNFGWYLLDSITNELGLSEVIKNHSKNSKYTYDLEEILKLLSFRRIINPASKLQTFNEQNKMFGNFDVKQHNVYRALSELNKIKDDLQIQIHGVVCNEYNRNVSVAFYDVTNYYFESDRTDDFLHDENGDINKYGLRYFGFSKEKRVKPIVQMGLFMDDKGIPICYKLFKGNIPDVSTYKEIIDEFKEKFGFGNITIVADKAMNTKKNIETNIKNGDHWIFSQKFRGNAGLTKEVYEYVSNKQGFVENDDKTFRIKAKVFDKKLSNGETVKEKVVVVYSKAFAARQQHELDKMIEITNEKLKNTQTELRRNAKIPSKYLIKEIKNTKITYVLDEERIANYKKWQGLNVIACSNLNMNMWDVLHQYHELWQIEDCFKITKSDLQARPVFVNVYEHIQGHFLICFISLVLLRLLQYKTNREFSVRNMKTAIKDMNCIEIGNGYYRNLMSKESNNLASSLGVDINRKYMSIEELRRVCKEIAYTRHFAK
jgi:transposase